MYVGLSSALCIVLCTFACTSVKVPFRHVLCVCMTIVYPCDRIGLHLYSTDSYSASINSWKMNQSHHSFLQKPMVTLHCPLHLIYLSQQRLKAWPQTSFQVSSQSLSPQRITRFLLFSALPCSRDSNLP